MADKYLNIKILITLLNSITVLSSILIFIVYFRYRNNHNFGIEIIFYFSISTFISGFASFLVFINGEEGDSGDDQDLNIFCKIQSILMTYSDFSTLIWNNLIGYTAYKFSVSDSFEDITSKYRKIFLFLGYFIPILFAIL